MQLGHAFDTRSVTRGEVLALRLARLAGIDAAPARIVEIDGVAVAIIERFDRTPDSARIPYLSAASMLQASRQHEHSYTEIADAIRANSPQPTADARQLWRRIVFNLLIKNVDDHLQNLGFLHVSNAQWRLAPLMAHCAYFSLTPALALAALADVVKSVFDWRTVARHATVGLHSHELNDFAPAFEHAQMDVARKLLR